ncbi:hypothetical protein SCLCIDRAFT_129929 [Scleroderma citrinum Foug A]|uniref:Major facilitator superfamily (MFS) profile domain-containing protein n=1 Tax=Scleroderma citrinum Foug A TaxID=1036808 RepID=A0A0C2ZZ31_9AGAM|nr:hypothetical protein SCLCIDRAFT_129929 [Scleroderma citrinum Foug A]
MSQQPLSGKRPYIDECQHEISTGGKPEEGRDSPLGVPSPCVVFDPKQESRLWRKVDLRLMPMIALMYLLCFMDRGNAKLDGLTTQLHLTGNQYNIALVIPMQVCFISDSRDNCRDFTSIIIQFVAPSKWLAGIMILWGIVMTLMGFVKTYPQLVAVRFCLGIAESGFYPGVAYYLTMWYPKYMLQCRFAIFLGAATSSGAFSGLLAYGINFMHGTGGLQGWSWIFILEGLATVLVGFIAIFVMVDYPSSAKFLTQEEKQLIIQRREFSQVDKGDDIGAQIRAAFTDWQVRSDRFGNNLWINSDQDEVYGITYFLPFGYSTSTSQLLTVPPYVLAGESFLIVMVLGAFAYFSDKMKLRSPFIFAAQLIALIGFIINITDVSSGVKYFGTFWCVAGSYTAAIGPIIWAANNLEGKYKRAVGMALVITMANFGGAIASNIFRTQDAPRYLLGFGIEIMFIVMGMLVIPVVVLMYMRLNARKDELERHVEETSGARGNIEVFDSEVKFRYTL